MLELNFFRKIIELYSYVLQPLAVRVPLVTIPNGLFYFHVESQLIYYLLVAHQKAIYMLNLLEKSVDFVLRHSLSKCVESLYDRRASNHWQVYHDIESRHSYKAPPDSIG